MVHFTYRMAGVIILAVLSGVALAAADPVTINETGTITVPGEYRLGNDIQALPGVPGLTILCPDTSLDGAGHRVTGTGDANTGLVIGNLTAGALPVANVTVTGLTVEGYGTGMLLADQAGASVTGCMVRNNSRGVVLSGNHVFLLGNHVVSNQISGLSVSGNTTGLIADNFLDNSVNLVLPDGSAALDIAWNLTREAGPSVTGGPFKGGNYWGSPQGDGFSDRAIDCAGDGFTGYPYPVGGVPTDLLPLAGKKRPAEVAETVSVSWVPNDPAEQSYYSSSRVTGNNGFGLSEDQRPLPNLTAGSNATLSFEVPANRSVSVLVNVTYENGTPAGTVNNTFWAANPPASETGRVRYFDLEGGFYGIITDDARNLYPLNLPGQFAQDGLEVRFIVADAPGTATVAMWGEPVTVVAMDSSVPVRSQKLDSVLRQFIDPKLIPGNKTVDDLVSELVQQGVMVPGSVIGNTTDPANHIRVEVSTAPCAPSGVAGRYLDQVIAADPEHGLVVGWLPLPQLSPIARDPDVSFVRVPVPPVVVVSDR